MTRGVLLDTSAWIGYLRPRGWGNIKTVVQQVLTVEQVYTCWMINDEAACRASSSSRASSQEQSARRTAFSNPSR